MFARQRMVRGPIVAGLVPAALLGALTTGCGASGGDDGAGPIDAAEIDGLGRACTPVIGDLTAPAEVRPVFVDYRGEVQPIAGGAVGLIRPIQGGHVLMVGLEGKNVPGCGITISGILRDPATGAMIAQEGRGTELLVGADGWGHVAFPPSATTANLTTCPLNMLPRDIDGSTWRLELMLIGDAGRLGSWEGDVVPFCRADDPDPSSCPCECDADFRFGDPCPVDPP